MAATRKKAVPPLRLRVGVSGHRRLGDPRVGFYVHAQCVRWLRQYQELAQAQGAEFVAYSALAIGADTLFAEAALGLGVPLIGVLPFATYAEDFEGPDLPRFEAMRGFCREVITLPPKKRSDEAYMGVGRYVVDETDVLLAVWNGQPAAGLGGTADVVAHAREKGRQVLVIDPAHATVPAEPAKKRK
jgi:hypothetical protein